MSRMSASDRRNVANCVGIRRQHSSNALLPERSTVSHFRLLQLFFFFGLAWSQRHGREGGSNHLPICSFAPSGSWKSLSNCLCSSGGTLSIGVLMDLLAAGKMMGWDTGSGAGVRYQVKMKLMDESISEQNRMILCKAVARDSDFTTEGGRDKKKEFAHERLTRAYIRAHKLHNKDGPSKAATRKTFRETVYINYMTMDWCIRSLLVGVGMGSALSLLIASQIRRK